MNSRLTRRGVISGAASLALGAGLRPAAADASFAFPLLGDLHYDRLSHHDMEWLKREQPNDVHQVQEYSEMTRESLPRLFPEVRALSQASRSKVPFVVHVGDFIEGVCGTPELALLQCHEAINFVRAEKLGAPFLFTKGNHDITGPGAKDAFDQALLPFLSEETGQELRRASYAVPQGDALFVYYDAYNRDSLAWLEKTLEARTERHLFFVIHPPVIPFGARSNWALFTRPGQEADRERLLRVLGRNRAMVLCGHLHKYGATVRRTPEGSFLQLMVSSIIRNPDAEPKNHLEGRKNCGPDLVLLEPKFSPDTAGVRRELLQSEAPHIGHFEYADAPGYAMIEVDGPKVQARIFKGLGARYWKTINLTELLSAG